MTKPSYLPCPLAAAAASAPDAPAIRYAGQSWTYAHWNARVAAATRALIAMSIVPDSRAGIVAANSPHYLTLLLALWRLSAIACPLNVRWPHERLAAIARTFGIAHVISDAPINLGPGVTTHALPGAIGEGEGIPTTAATLHNNQHATIYFTSGSSGEPKAVLHRLGNHYANAQASNNNIPYGPGDCWLLSLPLYHVSGMGILWRTLLARATMAIPDASEDLADALERYGVSHVSLVPTQLHRLLNNSSEATDPGGTLKRASAWGRAPLHTLKAILLGGSPVAPSLIGRAIALGLPLYKTYGLTEAASQVATTRPNDPPQALITSGMPLLPDSVSISGSGHIRIRGATRFEGYLVGNELQRPFDANGWFDTGDRGEWTPEGYLRVIGRADNMFISGGENVQPEEVERELGRIAGIEDALVVPVPDVEFGQRAVAFVRTAPPLDETALRKTLRARLPAYMIPTRFYPWPEHLVAADAKVNRQALRQYALTLQ